MQLGEKEAVDENQILFLSWDFHGKLIMKLKEVNPYTWLQNKAWLSTTGLFFLYHRGREEGIYLVPVQSQMLF